LQIFYETDYRIRFTVLWNGICNPFHKKICNFFWNGIQIPFHNTVKRILYSVSKKIANFCMKRITESVSHAFWFFHAKITPHPINFKPYSHVRSWFWDATFLNLIRIFFFSGKRNPFHNFWNGKCMPFPNRIHKFMKWKLYAVSDIFCFFLTPIH